MKIGLTSLLRKLLVWGAFNWMQDKSYLKLMYFAHMGKWLDFKDPKTFNEKIQWLKLYDRNPEYTKMVDKYEAKKYVASVIGEEYIIPTLGVWDCFEDIDFDSLPEKFVLKCTHDSGGVVIVRDKKKLDKEAARKKINYCLRRNYFWSTREWPYKNVKPRIIAEQYVMNEEDGELKDYKLMCFSGRVRCSFVCTNRNAKEGLCVNFYDTDWKPMPFERHYPRNPIETPKPNRYEKMVEFAEQLSHTIPFVRVDFYQNGEHLLFGELTFYPGSGLEEFTPVEWDYTLGSWLKTSEK